MTDSQRANFDKMLNQKPPKLKRLFNATVKVASDAWNSQPGIRTRLAAMAVAGATRTTVGAAGNVGRAGMDAARFARDNPRQVLDNTADLGGRALAATGRGIAAGTAAAGRGVVAGGAAAGRGAVAAGAAAGRGIANSAPGRWTKDTWSRTTGAAAAARQAFSNNGPAGGQDLVDLSDRAAAVVTARSPEEQTAAIQNLIGQLEKQIEKNNAGFASAQAPAAQAVQGSAATGTQQGTDQNQGERPQQAPDNKTKNTGVTR
jgi:hypothetical protein